MGDLLSSLMETVAAGAVGVAAAAGVTRPARSATVQAAVVRVRVRFIALFLMVGFLMGA